MHADQLQSDPPLAARPDGVGPAREYPDILIARLAARQHGAVSHAQLVRAGVSRSAIEHRVRTGRLHRVHRGVYLVGHTAESPFARAAAALLACGRGAALSHATAAALWRMRPGAAGPIHVTVVGRRLRDRPGIRVHIAAALDRRDLRRRHDLLVTAPARTLLDLAPVLSERDLSWAVNEGLVLRAVRPADLRDVLERADGARGRRALARAVAELTDGATPTRSEAERRLIDLLRRARLPIPETNVRVSGYRVDALWRAARLVIEVDSFGFHGTRRAFEEDRRRDADLHAAGHSVLRLTWRQITREPEATAAVVARALATAEQAA